MHRQYPPLPAISLAPYAACMLVRPAPNRVTLDSPAIEVMTDLTQVAAVTIEDVRAAKVGHIVASLMHAGRHHEFVAEIRTPAEVCIRGIFSATQIARQLGTPLSIPEVALTFAEVEQVLHEPR